MTELKTLKDLKHSEEYENLVSEEELRQEAIKWVKHYIETPDDDLVGDFIKHFFNLTEEDLK